MVKYGSAGDRTHGDVPTLDRALAAIADPTRRRILEQLGHGPASISELASPLGISLPGLLKQVRVLEEARLVETRKDGRTRRCRLDPAGLDEIAAWVEDHRRQWERRLDRLESYLANQRGRRA